MAVKPLGPARARVDRPGVLERVHGALGFVEAVMLYGSHARGSADALSDVDILAVVREGPRSVSDGDLAITAYLPGHLRALAERGSLFVLHLVSAGDTLHASDHVLADILDSYRSPSEPDRLHEELAVATAGLLAATPAERSGLGDPMRSLAFYVLRTAVYDSCARRGEPEFDWASALERLGLVHLGPLIAERRESYTEDRLDSVLSSLPAVLPGWQRHEAPGLAAAAVASAFDWPLASDLLAGVLAGHAVDYTALTLPPT